MEAEKEFPYPKEVSDFAKQYQALYISHCQYKTAYGYLQEEVKRLKAEIEELSQSQKVK